MRQLKITQSITNRESASFEKYLQDIGKESLITVDEEILLAQKIRQGDKIALDKLVLANLRFVVSVAKQYQSQGLTLPDLIDEGNLGLIKAAQRFDETKGFKFISYAVWWIRQSILQALAEQSRIVRLPLNQIGYLSKLNKAFSRLEQKFEREPCPEELALMLDVDVRVVHETQVAAGKPIISIDKEVIPGGGDTFAEQLACPEPSNHPTSDLITESLRKEIERSLTTLSLREAEVVRLYFGLGGNNPLTLEEIGEKFDLTRERVRQIKEKAIKRLKHESRSKILKTYLN